MITEPQIYFNFRQPEYNLSETFYHISYFYCGKDLYRRIWGSHSGDAVDSSLLRCYLVTVQKTKVHRI